MGRFGGRKKYHLNTFGLNAIGRDPQQGIPGLQIQHATFERDGESEILCWGNGKPCFGVMATFTGLFFLSAGDVRTASVMTMMGNGHFLKPRFCGTNAVTDLGAE